MIDVRQEVKDQLTRRGNRYHLTLLSILLVVCVVMPVVASLYLSSLMCHLFDMESGSVSDVLLRAAVILLLYGTVGLPAVGRSYYQAYRISCEGEGELNAPSYGRCFCLGFYLLLRYGIPLILLFGSFFTLQGLMIYELLPTPLAYQVLWIVMLAVASGLSLCWFLLVPSGFLVPFYLLRGNSLLRAIRQSRYTMKRQGNVARRYAARFFWPCVLSVLSVGVLYTMDTFAKMMLTYFALSKRMDREIKNGL